MRCYICDVVLSSPVYNSQTETFEPCSTCLDVINHVFEDSPEQPTLPLFDEEEESLDNVLENEYSEESDGSGDLSDVGPFETNQLI